MASSPIFGEKFHGLEPMNILWNKHRMANNVALFLNSVRDEKRKIGVDKMGERQIIH